MKKLLLISSLIACSLFGAEQVDEWQVSGRLSMYLQSIDVDGGTSSEREKSTHNEELNLNFAGSLGEGEAGIQSRLRVTNDRGIQENGADLLYLRSYYRDKIWTVEAGDVAASLNPYIFGGSLKGIKAVYKSPQKEHTWDYSIISGFKKNTWREVYEREENEAPTGYAAAIEAKYIHERAKELAISLATYKDDLSTGDSNTTVLGKKGFGLGLEGKWRFSKYVSLKGRAALTRGSDDIRNDKSNSSHEAIYLKLLTRPVLKSVKSNFTYQRVDSDFVSFGGSGTADKEQIENSTSWTINNEFRARMDLKANRNNLDSSDVNGTEKTYYEALSLRYSPEFMKRGDFTFRLSNKDIDRNVNDINSITAGVDFNLRDQSGWRYGAGYDYNNLDDSNTTTTHTFKALLGYKQDLSKESSYRFTIRPNYQMIQEQQDKIGFSIDAGYVHSKKLSADILYMTNQTDYDNSNNTQNSTYQFRTTYRLDAKGQNILRLLLEKRDVDVDDTPDSTYNEYIGKVSLVMNF